MNLFKRNNALALNGNTVNGATADIAITTRGSDWFFTVCAIMTVATAVFAGLSLRRPRSDRIFHYITASITGVAAVAYFTMGANLGFTPIRVEFPRSNPRVSGVYREIFYVRYIDWFITTPLLLMDLLLTAGLPWSSILVVIVADWIMIVTGLIGALVQSRYKWAYFVFGNIAFLYVLYKLAWTGRRSALALGPHVHKTYVSCGVLTLFVWCLYPIAWGVSEGGNVIAPDSEAVFYGILDVIAKPVFGALLLFGHRNIHAGELGLTVRGAGEHGVGGAYGEKHAAARNGTHNGAEHSTTTGGVHEPVGTTANTSTTTNPTTGTSTV